MTKIKHNTNQYDSAVSRWSEKVSRDSQREKMLARLLESYEELTDAQGELISHQNTRLSEANQLIALLAGTGKP